jgi:ubiquinone/menaquinone biosynthesis C-methylase UbiE
VVEEVMAVEELSSSLVMRLVRFLLAIAYRLLYNELAWTYDWVSWFVSQGHWRRWQQAAIPRLRGPRVLEVACGTGDLLLDLTAAGFACFGVDLSPQMVRIASKKLRRCGVSMALCRARAQALPFRSEVFDSVVLTFPPGFVREPRVLAEFRRVLVPHGRVVVVDAGRLRRRDPWSRFLNWAIGYTGEGIVQVTQSQVLERADFVTHEELDEDSWVAVNVIVGQKP